MNDQIGYRAAVDRAGGAQKKDKVRDVHFY